MSITDELRQYAYGYETMVNHRLLGIADRIDLAHERAIADAELCAAPTEGQMEELGYIALPVDADGVPIHVGDELEPTDEHGMRVTVSSIQFTDDGCWVFAGFVGRRPHKYRHVKPDTPDSWERIIEDVRSMDGCGSLGEFMERHGADLVARCKALAGEDA